MAGLFKTNEPTTILLDSVNDPSVITFHKKMGYLESGDLNEETDTVPMQKILPPVSTPFVAGAASGGKGRRYATRKH